MVIFALPFASRALGMPTGIAGAWIGMSEFADAAGLATAQAYYDFAKHTARARLPARRRRRCRRLR
ncbi:hypothetical protein WS70_11170 [Burkholderia mayonis]|uniref:Uncharacterized protein n=1 Tax=Burkholderia mayonis TaxID=1385591 RepID=A0A1B4FF20_9BURK|nr:hypothetical protein WS70_11170 [Burkholderia mayonis]KVE36129.1 hypothetical protein WS69_12935 [Burkholderia sp. BDU5]KVE47065.1 hypothetical protein WS70_27965 [Burkholderia mayonis]